MADEKPKRDDLNSANPVAGEIKRNIARAWAEKRGIKTDNAKRKMAAVELEKEQHAGLERDQSERRER